MVRMIVRTRQYFQRRLADVESVGRSCATWRWPLSFLAFVVTAFAKALLAAAGFIVSIPLHLLWTPQRGFQELARRKEDGEFLESYTAFIRHQRLSVLTSIAFFLLLVGQVFLSTIGIVYFTKPTRVEAYTTTVTINPTWDIAANEQVDTQANDFPPPDCYDTTYGYGCDSASATSLSTNFVVASCPSSITNKRMGLKFSLASIPNNATITKVELNVYVSGTTSATQTVYRVNSDTVDTQSCVSGAMYSTLGGSGGTNYANYTNWNTTGTKTADLGSTAVSEVQSRIVGSDILPLSITSGDVTGTINSVDNASNKPSIVVYYTLPPQAPTGTSHSGNTTSTIAWTWTDNATVETRYDVHDASHANVTGCTNLAADSQSCTETGLSANTQYTRHPNVTDPQGNTDGSSTSIYTSIETPTGVSLGSVTTTGITATASGTISNLTSGSSGLYFQESVTSTNSGWTQTNSWAKSGLTANTQYSFQAKARNGDGDETSLTSAVTKYTLSSTPNVASTRSTSTWYTSGAFPLTNAAGWGGGGVQYYRYAWDQTVTHTFSGSESTWSSVNANCPGGACSDAGTTLNRTATVDGNDWYLHVQAFNGDGVANGSGTNYGPYYFDSTNPTAPSTLNDGTGADQTYTTSTSQLSANWSAASDAASGLQKYQYAIGTTAGGTQVQGYTDNGTSTSVTKTGLSLSDGVTYYLSARAVDNAGNVGTAASSNGVMVNTSLPSITDNQTGDATPRKSSGTTYDVDFFKSSSGPPLDYAQYAVYAGPNKTGTLLKNWTDIFSADVDSFTTDWTVDFAALLESTNYVSVRVFTLDALSQELVDAFTVLKDTISPTVSGLSATTTTSSATVSWTTDEPATTHLEWGSTASYGNTTTLDATLRTSHSVTLSGLAANVEFHARALSTDQAGNSTTSADLPFTTLATPMTVISGVQVTKNNSTSVTVTWTTNEPATSKVRYGLTTDYGSEAFDDTLVTSHSLTITGLEPNTTYHYEVISTGSTTDFDADATFATPSTGVTTAISSVRAVAGESITTFFWTTNEPATSKVRYGLTTEYGRSASDSTKVTSHRLQVTGLTPGATYHFQLVSVGSTTDQTTDDTFTTTTPESTSRRAIAPTLFTPTLDDDGGTQPSLTLNGITKGNQTIRVYVDGKVVKTLKVGGSSSSTKSFSAELDLKKLKSGKHTLYVQSTDEVGRTSIVRQRITFRVAKRMNQTSVSVGTKAQYVVQPGDSLWTIAERHLGDGRRYVELVSLNAKTFPGLAAHPNIIQPGWTITIPAK